MSTKNLKAPSPEPRAPSPRRYSTVPGGEPVPVLWHSNGPFRSAARSAVWCAVGTEPVFPLFSPHTAVNRPNLVMFGMGKQVAHQEPDEEGRPQTSLCSAERAVALPCHPQPPGPSLHPAPSTARFPWGAGTRASPQTGPTVEPARRQLC